MKVLTNTKGPLTKGPDAPGTPAAALMRDLAVGLGGHKPSRGGALPGLGLKLVLAPSGLQPTLNTEPIFKQIFIDILADAC